MYFLLKLIWEEDLNVTDFFVHIQSIITGDRKGKVDPVIN
jgi:hypothetical protein